MDAVSIARRQIMTQPMEHGQVIVTCPTLSTPPVRSVPHSHGPLKYLSFTAMATATGVISGDIPQYRS